MSTETSDTVWLGDHPSEWHLTRIKRVSEFSPSFSTGKPELDEECAVVPMEAVSETGEIAVDNHERIGDVNTGLTLFENGDVLFAKITPCMENGKGAYVANLRVRYAFGSTEFLVLRPSHEIDGKFLYYATLNPTYRLWAKKNMYGAAGQQRVSTRFLKYTAIPLPALAEQKRIAAYLDASRTAIDRAVETKQKQLGVLAVLRKTIIQRAVTQGLNPSVKMKETGAAYLGQVPAHWRVSKMKRLLSEPLSYGLNEAGTDDNPDNPRYIRITDFGRDGKLRDETFRSLPPDIAAGAPLSKGDILLARSGATVGKSFFFADFDGPACYAGYLIRAAVAPHLMLPKFLYLYTRSLSYEAWKDLIFTQATIQNISAVKYAYLETPVPPVDEQEGIVEFLEAELEKIARLEQLIQAQVHSLVAYRKSLIHECVTGKRRVPEAQVAKVVAHV